MIFSLICALALCGSASADNAVGGQPIVTVANGTVNGGVYSDSYYGFNNSETNTNVTYNFKDLPDNAQVQNATLYVAVYSANMQEDHSVKVNTTFNGQNLEDTTFDSTYAYPDAGGNDNTAYGGTSSDPYLIINNHTVRVTSDYLMRYDVTNLTQKSNSIHVDATGSYDGRIKLITLIVAYNNGTSNNIAYWVNLGQDVSSYLEKENYGDNYTGTTTFSGNVPGTVENATLKVIHMASGDGIYTYNGNSLNSGVPQGSYSGSDSWDVTSFYNNTENTLTYTKGAGTGIYGYYKLPLVIQTVKYFVAAPVANFTANTTSIMDNSTVQFTDESTGSITSWLWNFGDGNTSSNQSPAHTYTTPGNYSVVLTVTGSGGSDTMTKTNYITVLPKYDLTITMVTTVDGSATFAGQTNDVSITVKNSGPDNVTNVPVALYVSDVNGGTKAIATGTVASIASGKTAIVKLTDPTIRPITASTVYGSSDVAHVIYSAVVDPDNILFETNEANNIKNSTSKPVYYNGYGGKGLYEYNGTDINTEHVYDIHGNIVYYTQPDSAYKGVGWTNRTETWNTTNLSVPSTGTIEDVWLYLAYNWDQTIGGHPNWTILFNGNDITNSSLAWYTDQSNAGGYAQYKYGLMVFNVTSMYNRDGDNNLTINALAGNVVALYPSTLAVVYQDPNETRKQIFINEQCDELLYSATYATTLEEATAYAPFTGMTIDTSKVKNATLYSFAGSAGPDEGNLFFNNQTIATLAWQGNSYTASALITDVTSYLTQNNRAGIQGTTSGGMDTLQQFLVVEYYVPVAGFTTNVTNGTVPLDVQFTDKSSYATSYAWDFDGDGTVDSTAQNPSYTYTKSGNYTVTETVTGPGGSNSTTSIITVNAPDLVVTNVTANNGAGGYMFANELNVISVTVKNNGTAAAPESTLNVNINGTDYTVNVPALAVGESTTVTVTDPVSRKDGDNVPVNTTTNPNNTIPETNTSNNSFSTSLTVYNNGYKGRRYTDGNDIDTQNTFQGNYNVEYSSGNSKYSGSGWTSNNVTWTSSELPIPEGATVTQVRLYQPYTWDKTIGQPQLNVIFNGGNVVNYIGWYTDTKGFGSSNYPSGLFVYDVTSLFNTAGNTLNMAPGTGTSLILYGSYLVVVYQDSNATNKTIIINDGCDMLYSNPSYSVNDTEATAYANFQNVSMSKAVNAKVIDILASANGDDGKGANQALFNGNVLGSFNSDYLKDPEISFSLFNITSLLQNGTNTAAMQSHNNATKGDNMVALSSLLVVEYDTVAPTVSADVNGGSYNASQSVNLTAKDNLDSNPTIYYTTDGSDPTTGSAKYAGSISVAKTTTLKFMAVDAAGNHSNIYNQTYTIPDADVYVNSTVSETNPKVGDTVTVTLKVGNNGPDTAHGVVVTYTVPEGMEFVGATTDTPSASAPVYNATNRIVTWNIGDVPVGDPKLFVTLKVLTAGKLAGNALVTSTSYDPVLTDDTGSLTVEAGNAQSATGQSTVGQENSTVGQKGASVANAAEVTTTSKVPMQPTGIPLAGLVLAVLSIFGGLLVPRRK
jgi:uncharacterized repeat protein (TIGR01451 family)